jgi:hypothetical protein
MARATETAFSVFKSTETKGITWDEPNLATHLPYLERWVAKLVARLLATAALWARVKTSLINTKWAT